MLYLDPYPFAHVQVDKGPTRVVLYHTNSSTVTFLLIFNECSSLKSNLIFMSVFGMMVRNNGHKRSFDVITSSMSVDDVIFIP